MVIFFTCQYFLLSPIYPISISLIQFSLHYSNILILSQHPKQNFHQEWIYYRRINNVMQVISIISGLYFYIIFNISKFYFNHLFWYVGYYTVHNSRQKNYIPISFQSLQSWVLCHVIFIRILICSINKTFKFLLYFTCFSWG